MSYVNIFGKEVNLNKHPPKTKAVKRNFTPSHNGWSVKGSSPDDYAKKVSERRYLIDSALSHNANPKNKKMAVPDELPPFSEWAKSNRIRANARPYASLSIALECRNQAAKAGWTNLEIIEIKKGDESQITEGFIWR